jgi:GNAT superfamily N-acetyltransferase
MAVSEAPTAVEVRLADVDACLRLSDEAGWNQTADDWRLFIRHGKTIGARSNDGTLVASAAALPYDRFGFVSMVLVTDAWRRRGLATDLVDRCVVALTSRGLVPVLDATPAGSLVYGRQGFNGLFELDRWQSEAGPELVDPEGETVAAGPGDFETLCALDREACGADRRLLLGDLLSREGSHAFLDPGRTGFAVVRRGRRAMQIGPVAAISPKRAIDLLSAALGAVRGSVFVDIPRLWDEVAGWLAGRGFTRQRSFTRMAHGHSTPFGRPDRLFAAAGPEFG